MVDRGRRSASRHVRSVSSTSSINCNRRRWQGNERESRIETSSPGGRNRAASMAPGRAAWVNCRPGACGLLACRSRPGRRRQPDGLCAACGQGDSGRRRHHRRRAHDVAYPDAGPRCPCDADSRYGPLADHRADRGTGRAGGRPDSSRGCVTTVDRRNGQSTTADPHHAGRPQAWRSRPSPGQCHRSQWRTGRHRLHAGRSRPSSWAGVRRALDPHEAPSTGRLVRRPRRDRPRDDATRRHTARNPCGWGIRMTVLGLFSARADGATTVAIGLAAVSAAKAPTLLIDLDLDNPEIATILDVDPEVGIFDLAYKAQLAPVERDELEQHTGVRDRIAVLPGINRRAAVDLDRLLWVVTPTARGTASLERRYWEAEREDAAWLKKAALLVNRHNGRAFTGFERYAADEYGLSTGGTLPETTDYWTRVDLQHSVDALNMAEIHTADPRYEKHHGPQALTARRAFDLLSESLTPVDLTAVERR